MIESLSLRNWCQHPKRDIVLRPGLNGILGRNGGGKSNLLDSLRFAITGKSVNHGNLSDNITWGQDDASVEVGFSVAGTRYTLKRSLNRAGKATARLKIEGGDPLAKAGEIQDFIEKLWDTNTEALLNNVFLAQGKLDSILFARPADRYKEFQKTFGLENLGKAHDWLKVEANAYQVTPDLDQMLATALALFEEAAGVRASLAQERQNLSDDVARLEPCEAVIRLAIEATRTQQAIVQADAQVVAARDAFTMAIAAMEAGANAADVERAVVDVMRPNADQAKIDLPRLRQEVADWSKTTLARDRRAVVQSEMVTLVPTVEVVDGLRKEVSDLEAEYARLNRMLTDPNARPKLPEEVELEKEIQQIEFTLQPLQACRGVPPRSEQLIRMEHQHDALCKQLALVLKGECPTCGQKFCTDAGTLSDEIKKLDAAVTAMKNTAVADLNRQIIELKAAAEDRGLKRAKYATAAKEAIQGAIDAVMAKGKVATANRDLNLKVFTEHQNRVNELKVLDAALAHAPTSAPDETKIDALVAFLAQWDAAETRSRAAETKHQLAKADFGAKTSALAQAESNRKILGDAVQAPSAEQVAQAQADAMTLSARRKALNEVLQQIGINQALVSQREAEVTRLREKMIREGAMAKWVDEVKLVRDTLHVTALPTLVMREFARVLNVRLETYLSLWEAPFRMWLDDELCFKVDFNGSVIDAERLSGGQKITASTSFRLAMSDTFASSVGLLILDEPSVYLDKDNIQHLQTLLLKLKEMSSHSGRQILVVTHEESLMGFMDHVVNL